MNNRVEPGKFTLRTVGKRIDKLGDLWKTVLGPGVDLAACLERLRRETKGVACHPFSKWVMCLGVVLDTGNYVVPRPLFKNPLLFSLAGVSSASYFGRRGNNARSVTFQADRLSIVQPDSLAAARGTYICLSFLEPHFRPGSTRCRILSAGRHVGLTVRRSRLHDGFC